MKTFLIGLIALSSLTAFAKQYEITVTHIDSHQMTNNEVGGNLIAYTLFTDKEISGSFICDKGVPEDGRGISTYGLATLNQGEFYRARNGFLVEKSTSIVYHKAGECRLAVEEVYKKLNNNGRAIITFDEEKILKI
jgi:hypothetical protein